MDINEKQAFLTNDWAHHRNFLDAVLCAMERNLVNFTYVNYCKIYFSLKYHFLNNSCFYRLWNYNPTNDNTHGDHWYGEDFSIFSRSSNEKPIKTITETTITKTRKTKANGVVKSVTTNQKLQIQTKFPNTFETPTIDNLDNNPTSPTSPTSPFDLTQVHFWEQEDGSDNEQFHHQGGRVLEAVLVSILGTLK
jgi:hypothetical protein